MMFGKVFSFLRLTLLFAIISLPTNSLAAHVTFEWDHNSEPDLAGYRVFSRLENQKYDYQNPAWEGTATTCLITLDHEGAIYYFIVRAFDTQGLESADSNEVIYEPLMTAGNLPPVADAGSDQLVNEQVLVTLNASGSYDLDDGITFLQWSQISGISVSLFDSDDELATFIAPDVGEGGAALEFQVTVIDYDSQQSTDTCVVNVTSLNQPPHANAGEDQTVEEGDLVALNGMRSYDPDDGIESFYWKQIAGPSVTLTNPTAIQTTFVAPPVTSSGVTLAFEFIVKDNNGLQHVDECFVIVTHDNMAPVAIIGKDQSVLSGDEVMLSGDGSYDPDGETVQYRWKQLSGIPVMFNDSTTMNLLFIAPEVASGSVETLIFQLIVTDAEGLQATDDCIVTVDGGNKELIGDVDGNGVVTWLDLRLIKRYYRLSGEPGWIPADVNTDGIVDITDYKIVKSHMGERI